MNMRIIPIRIAIFGRARVAIKSARLIGSHASPRKVENILAPIIIKKIIAVVLPVSRRHQTRLFILIFPFDREKIKAPKAPTPAASVGVNIPI